MTRLTVALTATTESKVLAEIGRAEELGAEAVEVRLDYLAEPIDYDRVVQACKLPIVWTNRHPAEGGRFTGSEDQRIGQLVCAIEAGGQYIDVEHQFWSANEELKKRVIDTLKKVRSGGRDVKLILSYHNFSCTPDDLGSIVRRIEAENDADVVKFAVLANDIFDNFSVLKEIRECTKPVIGLAMGETGQISRILAKKLGCEITFAALERDKASAPGQLTVRELKEDYNWDRIARDTKVLGVVGHPVEHSLSPQVHNVAYLKMGLNAMYLRFDVPEGYEVFAGFVDKLIEFNWLDALGLSVTIPHKLNAIRYLESKGGQIDDLAAHIGAVNTIRLGGAGGPHGINSDYLGLLAALTEGAGLSPEDLTGRRVAVLGAGGVARAIVAAMKHYKAEVTIYNRTTGKAEALAGEFDCECRAWSERNSLEADIVINGTSIGMWPQVDQSPLDASTIKSGMVVFDTVYNPLETKLLREARSVGARAVDGASMLVHQAWGQIEFWFADLVPRERPIPLEAMRRALMRNLQRS